MENIPSYAKIVNSFSTSRFVNSSKNHSSSIVTFFGEDYLDSLDPDIPTTGNMPQFCGKYNLLL